VVIGASNLTRGMDVVVKTARAVWDQPLEIYAALGHGRSFGMTSRVLFRQLPGVLDSGLWPALEAARPLETAALVTDIGNDLLYEAPVEQVAEWVDECLARLARLASPTVITQLPVENLADLSPRRFRFFRRLFMPRCTLELDEVVGRVDRLNRLVCQIAARHGAVCIAQQRAWYGVDPMHFPLKLRGPVWREILSPWATERALPAAAHSSALGTLRLRALAPEVRWLFGREQRTAQPAGRLPDGTTVALY
jgi:hypothetical protein